MSLKKLLLLLTLAPFAACSAVDLVKVDKSKRRLYLIENERITHEFRIALGKQPKGHKSEQGDQRTRRTILSSIHPRRL